MRAGIYRQHCTVSVSPGLLVPPPPGTFWSRVAPGKGQSHQHFPGRGGQLEHRGCIPKQCHIWQHSSPWEGMALPLLQPCPAGIPELPPLSTARSSHSQLGTTGLEEDWGCIREGNLLKCWHCLSITKPQEMGPVGKGEGEVGEEGFKSSRRSCGWLC